MLPLRANNPLAPAAYNGLSSIGPDYEDEDFCKQTAVIALTAGQTLLNYNVQLDKDADYILTAIYGKGRGYAVRFSDQNGFYLMDNFMGSMAFSTASSEVGIPFVLPIGMYFPRGSSILIDLIEQTGAPNNVSFTFHGIKHFVTAS